MCQVKSEGGLRCPIHRYDSSAAIKVAIESSGLSKDQVEKLFSELRREGRTNEPARPNAQWNHILRKIKNTSTNPETKAKVIELAEKGRQGNTPDGATLYALQRIVDRSDEQAANLKSALEVLATKAGVNNGEAKENFAKAYASVDRSRKAETPDEFTKDAITKAKTAGLPHDISTVVALERMRTEPDYGPRRVTLTPVPHSTFISSIGYDADGGRLEVTFQSNPNTIFAYKNVPEETWDRMEGTRSAGRIYSSEIRGNANYQYASNQDAEDDGKTIRCDACGQYRAMSHSCPPRELENELVAKGLSGEAAKIVAVMPDMAVEEIDSRTAAQIENDIAAVRSQLDDKSNYIDSVELQMAALQANYEAAIALREKRNALVAEEEAALAARIKEDNLAAEIARKEAIKNAVPLETVPSTISTEGRHGIPAYAPTVENQRNPQSFSYNDQKITDSIKSSGFAQVTGPSDLQIRNHDYFQDLSISERVEIENRELNQSFIVSYSILDDVTNANIIRRFNSDEHRMENSRSPYYNQGFKEREYSLIPLGVPYVKEEYTEEQKRELREAEIARLSQAVADGNAVYVESNNSMTRKYKLDGNLDKNHRIAFAKASELRNALKDGKIAVFNIRVENPQGYSVMDDQGVEGKGSYSRGEQVHGNIGVRKNSDGVIEMVSSKNSLQCGCYEYRNNYHCEHVDYVQRHIANAVQQSLPVERTHSLLTASLSARSDITVVENDPTRGTYISFGTEPLDRYSAGSSRRSGRSTQYHNDQYIMPIAASASDILTHEQLAAVITIKQTLGHLRLVVAPPNPTGIRQALKRANVEIPVTAEFSSSRWDPAADGRVTGTMTLAKTDDDLPAIVHHTLKCTCPEYKEKYDCQHIRATVTQPQIFTHIGMRSWEPDEDSSLKNFAYHQAEAIRQENNITRTMDYHRIDREAAIEFIADQENRERREREEREERYRLLREAEEERDRAKREEERVANLTLHEDYASYRAEQKQRWQTKDEGYETNPAAFYEAYTQTINRKGRGSEAIPYQMENVTDGICADVPGARRFGIELEFDIKPGFDRYSSLSKIGKELHEAGLTDTAEQVGYHTAAEKGWTSWSFEEDMTVDAELVSPILSDTPESWAQIQQVTEIIERNGGHATTRCGSHVHVSTGSYGLSTAKHAELLRTMNQNEDTIFRLASNPATGKHRGTRWCRPNLNDNESDIDAERQADHGVLAQGGHALALNFESASSSSFRKRNIEFRMWDGSISASTIQQQIKVSAALTEYAERQVETHKKSEKPKEEREKIGHNRRREEDILERAGTRKHNAGTFEETNKGVATFLDKLFRKNEDKAGVVSLFALTNWQTQ